MGFGFNLFFVFVVVPLTGLLLLAWLVTQKTSTLRLIGYMWLGIFGLLLISGTVQWLKAKKELDKDDYYGHYVVDRDYFPGQTGQLAVRPLPVRDKR